MEKKLTRIFALLLALAMIGAACGAEEAAEEATEAAGDAMDEAEEAAGDAMDEAEEAAGDAMDEVEDAVGGDAEGEIFISGSSTVEPISAEVALGFADVQPGVNVAVEGPGTGDGFKKFCAGETDISDASRQIKDEEAADCEAAGIEYVELKVAVDGIAAMTSAANDAIDCVSFADMYSIVGPESNGFETWAAANELNTEVGGAGDLPDAPLVITAPGTESGTYDSFVEIVLEDFADEREQEAAPRVDYTSAADDNVIIEGVSSNDTSFGWVGFAFAAEAEGVKLLEVSAEEGGTCVAATPETIASNEYPIARDLFIYVNKAMAAEKPYLVEFVDYYMGFGLDDAAAVVGYVELTDDSKAETIAAWEGR